MSFQVSNLVFLATFNAIKMKVWRCCGVVSEERLSDRETEGERGMLRLRISDSFIMTSDKKRPTGVQSHNAWKRLSIAVGQYVQVLLSVNLIWYILRVVMRTLCRTLY